MSANKKKRINFLHHTAPNETGIFAVTLYIDDDERASGFGRNKKEAEQDACVNAIKELKLDA